ncbi:MAG: DUF6452 family protein [Flavobacteriaceae bacterium]
MTYKPFITAHLHTRALILGLLIVLGLFSCEKDDICVEGDTPLLIIRFYDAESPLEFKSVSSLRVRGLGQESAVNTFTDRSSLDSISIPLRINEPNTDFVFISESATEDDLETGNLDTLRFSYNTREVFASRACGFIANFEELNDSLVNDGDNWIQSIEIISTTINSQASAHVEIFH